MKRFRRIHASCTRLSVRFSAVAMLIALLGGGAFAAGPDNGKIVITGTVTDLNGAPLANTTVLIKGTARGTQTNAAGAYTIDAPADATLTFSFVGYEQQEVLVGGRTTIDVRMTPSASATGEAVVVIGYGTQRKRDVTGAVASVRGADIALQPVQTATQAVQGKLAGVQIISSGEPNSLPSVRIRGTGSVLAGVNPLYVVDGVLTDDIRNINNADIVSFDVLKDASASAIYGVRGANGVIIITTKRGRSGKTTFSYNGNAGIREATDLVNMAGEQQYAGYLNEAQEFYNGGGVLIQPAALQGYNTDWYDEILRRAFYQNHSVSASGGSDKFLYFLSAGFLDEEGILKDNQFRRYNFRANNEYTFSTKFKLNSTVSYSSGDARGGQFSAFGNAYRAAPTVPAKVGGLYGNTSAAGNVANPVLDIDKTFNKVISNRLQGNVGLDFKPVTSLTLRTAVNFEKNDVNGTNYAYRYLNDGTTFVTTGGNQSNANSTLNTDRFESNTMIWDNTATYIKDFGNHSLNVLAGFVAQRDRANSLSGSARDVPENMDQWYLGSGTQGTQTVSNSGARRTRLSYLGRVNYGFKNKYLLTGTLRADGTSNFGPENRYGYFPSVAAGWVISSEDFMSDQQTFDNLKLRASYGKKGNDNIGSGLFTQTATQNLPYYFGGAVFQGIAFESLVDRNLAWETTSEIDFGVDFTILNNKLTGTFDWYSKKVEDALINIGLPAFVGDPNGVYLTNAANISNKGVELALNWNDKIGRDWTYGLNLNVSHNENRIEELAGGQPLIGGGAGAFSVTKTDNGRPIASFFVLDAIGIFQSQAEIDASAQPDARAGDLIYRDISGPQGKPDGVISPEDRVYAGSYQPKVSYGFNGNVAYRGFDMSFGTFGQAGGKIYNAKKAARGTNQLTDNIEASVARNRWTPNNRTGGEPRASLQALPASTHFIESGDFFRLNNLTLGYTLPKSMMAKGRISNLRVYVTGQNLFTITPYSGFTPEFITGVLDAGVDSNTYPTTRTFAFGVNVGF